ncbi:MAG: glycoside hydrolase family 13 [Verrucomicrobiota bacterium]
MPGGRGKTKADGYRPRSRPWSFIRHSAAGRQYGPHKQVSFFCAAPRAKSVELVGDFNEWQPLPMTRSMDGWWLAQVELCHGHHQYRFLTDGQPTLDPHAVGIARDDQNERASLIAVS